MNVCMLAAENGALPGAKVGGIGDVIRDLPLALASTGTNVSVVLPSYDQLHILDGMQRIAECTVPFRGQHQTVFVYRLESPNRSNNAETDAIVTQYVLHHPLFGVCGAGKVYCDDENGQPFATDASKFALYCAAALVAIRDGCIGKVDVLHLHDWHAGLAAVLKTFHPDFTELRDLRCVFSIHNLALQGVRPLAEQASSLQAWFPELEYAPESLADPRWPHCVNPMVAGIRLCDTVSTVSPGYALEIVQADDVERGFHGGEGLEADLRERAAEDRLVGIVNGIDYPDSGRLRDAWDAFRDAFNNALLASLSSEEELRGVDYLAHQRVLAWQQMSAPTHLLTSVGRLTSQKAMLLLTPDEDGQSALESVLQLLDDRGLFVMLGSGDSSLEQFCRSLASRYPHFIFINRYSERLSELLYAQGDLFLMPSSFEPCGISQMLAMRSGQPCVVHAVGGLADTVADGVDGFQFSGNSTSEQIKNFVRRVKDVIELREQNPASYEAVVKNARQKRFPWEQSARRYVSEVYQ